MTILAIDPGPERSAYVLWDGARVGGQGIVAMLPRLDVKIHLCKTAKAKDANIRQALIDRFGYPGTKHHPGVLYGVKTHCWAALGVAVCAYDRLALMGKETNE